MGILYYFDAKKDTIEEMVLPIAAGGNIQRPTTSSATGSPVGTALFFTGVDAGLLFVPADGASYSGLDYPEALLQLGKPGDPENTFSCPDLRCSPPYHDGRWVIFMGSDARAKARLFSGQAYCGDIGVYCGLLLSDGDL